MVLVLVISSLPMLDVLIGREIIYTKNNLKCVKIQNVYLKFNVPDMKT